MKKGPSFTTDTHIYSLVDVFTQLQKPHLLKNGKILAKKHKTQSLISIFLRKKKKKRSLEVHLLIDKSSYAESKMFLI